MRIALLTEGGYPYAGGRSGAWCDRLLRGLRHHDFEICAFSRSRRQAVGLLAPMPPNVTRVRTAALWGPPGRPDGGGRRDGAERGVPRWLARRYAESFAELTAALWWPDAVGAVERSGTGRSGGERSGGERPRTGAPGEAAMADRFATALGALADSAVGHGGLGGWLLSADAVRALAPACRAPGAPRAVRAARPDELEAVCRHLERLLRPLSLPWYGDLPRPRHGSSAARRDPGLGAVRLCHAVGTGPAALPGLLARHFHGVPLVVSAGGEGERASRPAAGVPAAYSAHAVAPTAPSAPVRAVLAAVRERLTEVVWAAAVPAGEGVPGSPGSAPAYADWDCHGAGEFHTGGAAPGGPPAWRPVPGCPVDRARPDHAGPPGTPGRPVPRARESIPPGRRPASVGSGAASPGHSAGHRADTGFVPPGHAPGSRA